MDRIDRRQFLASVSAAALTLKANAEAPKPAPKHTGPALFKLGCQSAPTNDAHLGYFARYGVRHICGYPETSGGRTFPTLEELNRMKDLAAKHKIEIVCVGPPILESSFIDKERHPSIMLAQSPERDRDIEQFQNLIRNCAQAGLPSIKYNMSILGVLRSGKQPGRGDEIDSVWNLAEAPYTKERVIVGGHDDTKGNTMPIDTTQGLTRAGHVDADAFWERITYFLDRVVPVANENKIRLACHPHDPGVPPSGYMGVDRVLGTVDGLKHFITINESPYHGLNFCQGTVSEMLHNPNEEIHDVIRYFGTRNKIFNVHFRNIRGHRDNFVEVYPDEGDVDMVQAIRTYKEVGYQYMLMPDHVPTAASDPGGLQSFAFCYGYIRGLIQSVNHA
ncbi:D-mannonate dehydratase [Granulicella pectinivorans]|uniref:mannonate dehydratase n=1 Tax=Granulicella pectinivorans TaxID=474950 RepID=A0A1I6MNA3_9BACT|nr:mannonate dehydratase [Granulicella pectinivorans]SFS17183.1 D-mannonate dehydratase [Granulicella pectinivorans]